MNLELAGLSAIITNSETQAGAAVARALSAEGASLARAGSADIAVFVLPPLPEGGFEDLEPDGFDEALSHVTAAAALFQAQLPDMKARGRGRLLFVGPVEAKAMTARAGDLDRTVGLAILGMMKAMSGEVGPRGITCNAILWDSARTGGDRERMLTAAGATAAYLASPLAGFLTGMIIAVDDARQGGVF